MKKHNIKHVAGIMLLAGSGLVLTSCSSSGGGGLSEPVCDASGSWTIYAVVSTNSSYCAGEDGTGRYLYPYITQNENTLSVNVSGDVFSGTISGSTVSWNGSYPEDGGTTTESLTGTVNDTCTSISGSTNWSWTDGVGSCTGTSTFSGVR